nr:EOG090X0DE4 [Lepidurus arcticus]
MKVPPEFAAELSGFGGKLKYLTIWDVLLQFGFFLLCFLGDIRSLLTSKSQKKAAKQSNCVLDTTFASLVFPLGNFVALTFWSIWAVDRELILPASMDSFYPSWLNHVMHTSIVPFDFIELALVNHIFPSRSLGIAVLVLFMLTYLIWTFFIAYYGGFWVYPILAYLDWGSRSLFILGCVAITVILYLTGELCSYLVWGSTGSALRIGPQYIANAGVKTFEPPPSYTGVKMPERPKLKFLEKVPQYPPTIRPPKMMKRLILMRGPEEIHNQLTLKQYGIIALHGGRLHSGHLEMLRLGIGRKMDTSRMFAIWRIDAPWKAITKKGQGKRMGGGKGPIDHYVTPVKAGRVIVEVGGACEFAEVNAFLKEMAHNLPFKAEVVSQEILEQKAAEAERLRLANRNPYTAEYLIKNNIQGCNNWLSPYDKKWFWKHV